MKDGQALELALLGQRGDLRESEARPHAGEAVEEPHQVLQVLAVRGRLAQEPEDAGGQLDPGLRAADELRAQLVEAVAPRLRARRPRSGEAGRRSQELPHRVGQGEGVERLGDHGARAQLLEPLDLGRHRGRGQEDHGDGRGLRVGAQRGEGGGPIHGRHHHVQEDGVRTRVLRDPQALGPAARLADRDLVHGEGQAHELPRIGVVVDDKDFHRPASPPCIDAPTYSPGG